MSEWRSIESAPRDGTPMLCYLPKPRLQSVGHFSIGTCKQTLNSRDMWVFGGSVFGFDAGKPTHWMPLPAPPEQEEKP